MLRTRLEYPLDAGAKPVGVLARDLDGDGAAEWIGVTREPGSVQIGAGVSPRSASLPRVVTMGFGDWPLPPVWIGKDAQLAFATRAPDELVVLDAQRLLLQQDASSVLARVPLERRARVIAAGSLGGQRVIGVVHVDDTLSLYDEKLQRIAQTPLADPHACALHFHPDGSGFVVGFQGSRTLRAYARSAQGEFTVTEPVQLAGLPRALHGCDVDGDGDAELACAYGERSLAVFGLGDKRTLTESLTRAPRTIEVARVPIALASTVTARGCELAVLSLAGQEYARLVWKQGEFECVQRGYAGQHPVHMALADLDGRDGPDLISANTGAERWSVLFAGADGRFLEAGRVETGRSPHSVASADLDGDGRLDVGVIHALEGTLGTLLNRAGKLERRQLRQRAAGGDRLLLFDVDGDRRADAVWISRAGPEAELHTAFGDGTGQVFERGDRPPLRLQGAPMDAAWVAEANTLLLADPQRRRLLLLSPANGSWSLRADQELDFAVQSVRAWIQAGELHVALGGTEGVLNVQRRAIGAEASAPWTPLARIETPGSVRALCAQDLDGDGRMDLAALCVEAGTDKPGVVQVVQQRESGFASVGPRLWTGARPYAIQAADLNGDGRAELTVSAQNSHQMNLWIGRAGAEPGFSAAPDLGVGTGPLDCMFCDLDGDGVAELITTNAFSDDLSVVSFR
jgi:hypothetical protein